MKKLKTLDQEIKEDKYTKIGIKLMIGFFSAFILLNIYSIWFRTDTVIGNSMFPTLQNREIGILYTKSSEIKRGDIVAINAPDTPTIEGDTYIKRIIGVGGDEIRIEETHNSCDVYVNGTKLSEPYYNQAEIEDSQINKNSYDLYYDNYSITIVVPTNEIFVMGDNRPISNDSRKFGTIKESDIVGKLIYH